jgi:hypothetical protein
MRGGKPLLGVLLAGLLVASTAVAFGTFAGATGSQQQTGCSDYAVELNTTEPLSPVVATFYGGEDGCNVPQSAIPEGQTSVTIGAIEITTGGGLNFTDFTPLSRQFVGVDRGGNNSAIAATGAIDAPLGSTVQDVTIINNGSGFNATFKRSPVTGRFVRVSAGDELLTRIGGKDANNNSVADIQTGPAGTYQLTAVGYAANSSFVTEPVTGTLTIGRSEAGDNRTTTAAETTTTAGDAPTDADDATTTADAETTTEADDATTETEADTTTDADTATATAVSTPSATAEPTAAGTTTSRAGEQDDKAGQTATTTADGGDGKAKRATDDTGGDGTAGSNGKAKMA